MPETIAQRRAAEFRRRLIPFGYLAPTIALVAILMVVSIVIVIRYSVLDNVIVTRVSDFVGLDNYAKVLTDPAFYTALRHTLYFSLVTVGAHFLLGMTFATLLNTKLLGPRTMALFRVIYIVPWVFTVAIVAVLWRMLLDPHGVINYILIQLGLIDVGVEWLSDPGLALHVVTFISIWAGYPFFMVSLLAGLQGIPGDLYEAATVDGANWIRRFWHVTLPQLRPIIVSMGLLDLIWSSQQFALIWLTTGGGPMGSTEVLSTYTYSLAFGRTQFSLASASAVIVLILSMILAFLYTKHQRARD